MFRVEDMLAAIDAVRGYTTNMGFEDFQRDRRTVNAVVRNLITIGEAASHVPQEVSAANPQIPWTEIRAMRNFVVHEYFGVSDKILWDTVQHDLPEIIQPLRTLLDKGDA